MFLSYHDFVLFCFVLFLWLSFLDNLKQIKSLTFSSGVSLELAKIFESYVFQTSRNNSATLSKICTG